MPIAKDTLLIHPCKLDTRIPAADGLEQWLAFLSVLLVSADCRYPERLYAEQLTCRR